MTAPAPATAHLTGWDRLVIVALGAAGCALSYDALQQMAVAIHVRGLLTYLFPLVIDGFIAYGVRALLVLRNAPLPARLYVWTLFGVATAASIWANALHAVRLNQEDRAVTGLRLGDTVVAVLSTVAPLALAGAVHLYILIARGPDKDSGRPDRADFGQSERIPVTRAADRLGQPVTALTGPVGQDTGQTRLPLDGPYPDTRSVTGASGRPDTRGADSRRPVTVLTGRTTGRGRRPADTPAPDTRTAVRLSARPDSFSAQSMSGHPRPLSERPDMGGQPGSSSADTVRQADAGRPAAALTGAAGRTTERERQPSDVADPDTRTGTGASDRPGTFPADEGRPVSARPVTHPDRPLLVTAPDSRTPGDRPGEADTESLLEIAQQAVRAEDKLTRKVVAQAIRGQRIPLSNDRLTELMVHLRAQHGQSVTTSRH